MHYYNHNISDYQSHTAHLDELEDIAYRRMMDYCYLHEIGLPKDVSEIARLIRMRSHTDAITVVLKEFFKLDGDTYRQNRIEKEIQKYREKSAKASASAKSRWRKSGDDDDADASPDESGGTAKQKPPTKKQKPRDNPIVVEIFDHWKKVMERTDQTKLSDADASKINARLKSYSPEQLKQAIEGNRFSPYHCGQNERQTVYDTLELIFRNDEKTLMFIRLYEKLKDGPQQGSLDGWLDEPE